jgi:hypothetical protein
MRKWVICGCPSAASASTVPHMRDGTLALAARAEALPIILTYAYDYHSLLQKP